ncbi:MAG: SpoIID/LytB domain-containing protein [Cetobacterium sp.]
MNLKKILMSFSFIILLGCSSTEKEYYSKSSNREVKTKKPTSSKKNVSQKGSNLKGDRVDLYGQYKKDSVPIAKPITYLKYVNDLVSPKTPFKSYSESEFLSFYKNTKVKGHGDSSSYWRWKLSLSKKDLSGALNKNLLSLSKRRPKEVLSYSKGEWIAKTLELNPVGDLIDIRILERGKSGLVIKLLVKGTRGQYIVAKEGNIRSLLGVGKNSVNSTVNIYGAKGGSVKYSDKPISKNPSLLPSAFLAIEKTSNGIYNIYGGGYGHGAGIPQWSAMDLTKNKGYSYKQVLQRYYFDTKLKNMKSVDGLSQRIKVGIMNSGFSSLNHSKVSMYSSGSLKIKSKDANLTITPNNSVEFISKNGFVEVIVGGKLRIKTKNHISITSNKMISLTNVKRNVKNYKYPTYRGSFEIRLADLGKSLNLINELSVEDYLLQVVPSEMPKSFGLEALKVQAIAARTYAAKDILRNRYAKLGFHILDSTQSQVYNNLDENELSNEAIKSTKGLILIHENKPIDAKYYSTSSGFNSNAHNIW